jgi:hypothetical protein
LNIFELEIQRTIGGMEVLQKLHLSKVLKFLHFGNIVFKQRLLLGIAGPLILRF